MRVQGDHWVDDEGRRLVLRGVNVGGDCKVPTRPDGDTRLKGGFYDRNGASFVGRPFALAEADEHFTRLKRWGLDFLRFLVTWEAVEHDGPGIYDEEYLDYIERMAAKAGEHGLSLFIDPHQDAWSRWTGGDGAPMWTLEAAGFEPERLFASGAAILNQEMGAAYPRMAWISNYDRLACATMWTLFFAGDAFAPGIGPLGFSEPGDIASMQDFLQGHYIAAMAKVAARVAPFSNVVGFDSLNEPNSGFIGVPDLRRLGSMMSMGASPTPWEAILAGAGRPVDVDVLGISGLARKKVGSQRLGAKGIRAWKDGVDCIWRRAGVWDEGGGTADGAPVLKRPEHFFSTARGGSVDFTRHYLEPFIRRFDHGVCEAEGGARRFVLFVEGVPNAERPTLAVAGEGADSGGVVDANHWYDDLTLVTKRRISFVAYDARHDRIVLGRKRVRRYFSEALRELKAYSAERMGGAPTLLGEFGIPFDMKGSRAYETGDYRRQERALAANYDAVDAALIDSTLWNYTADNRHARGDLWNTEDLSIFCRDEREAGRTETGYSADAGGRALRGFVRPYARATAGEILEMGFDARRGTFLLRFRPDPAVAAPTEVFLPALQYPRGYSIETEGCEARVAKGAILLRASEGADEAVLRVVRT
jgi:hypothetical protein